MGACCGRGSKKAKAAAAHKSGPVEFSTTMKPVQGRCPLCGSGGRYAKRFSNGVRIRIWICDENGHICPIG